MAALLGGAGGAAGAGGGLSTIGGSGGMSGGQLLGSLMGSGGGSSQGMKGGRASGKDMSDWAFKYYHDYESDPQGRPMQEGINQMQGLTQMAQQQPQKSPWEPILANNQNDVNTYIEQLMRKYRGQ